MRNNILFFDTDAMTLQIKVFCAMIEYSLVQIGQARNRIRLQTLL